MPGPGVRVKVGDSSWREFNLIAAKQAGRRVDPDLSRKQHVAVLGEMSIGGRHGPPVDRRRGTTVDEVLRRALDPRLGVLVSDGLFSVFLYDDLLARPSERPQTFHGRR